MNLDEATERKHLASIISILLDRAFRESSEFNHMFMCAGEDLAECLLHLEVAEVDRAIIKLTASKDSILEKIATAPISEVPMVGDALDVLLGIEAQ